MTDENLPSIEWIIGFIEGEGSFTVGTSGGKKKIPVFSISQNEKEILLKIQKRLGMGRLYYHPANPQKNNSKDNWHLAIRKYEDVKKLCQIVDGNMHCVNKIKQFEKWKEMLKNYNPKKLRWTLEQEELLVKFLNEGKSYSEISGIINKTVIACKARNWSKFNIKYKKGGETYGSKDFSGDKRSERGRSSEDNGTN